MNYVYMTHNHRIGDKIVLEACFRDWKKTNKNHLILMDDKRKELPSHGLELDCFCSPHIDEYIAVHSERNFVVPSNSQRFDFGNLWIALPKLRAKGVYPDIKRKIITTWLDLADKELDSYAIKSQFICAHLLTNPGYNPKRRHSFENMEVILRALANKGITIVRLGEQLDDVILHKNIFDMTRRKFDIMLSTAIVSKCSLFIGGDTGLSHIAAATNRKILAIYGDNSHDKQAFGEGWESYPNTVDKRISIFTMYENLVDVTKVVDEAKRLFDGGDGMGYEPIRWL